VCGQVLLSPKFDGLGHRVDRMLKQVCLRSVQRRQGLLRSARHGDVGATAKVVPVVSNYSAGQLR